MHLIKRNVITIYLDVFYSDEAVIVLSKIFITKSCSFCDTFLLFWNTPLFAYLNSSLAR